MNLTFVYGSWACGPRPFDFSRLYEDSRGLTGSETSCFSYAKEMAKRSHKIRLFAPILPGLDGFDWNGVTVRPIEAWDFCRGVPDSDAVLAWNEPDQLRGVPASSIRLVNQQLNDFGYCQPGFDQFVDVYTSPCQAHLEHMTSNWGSREKWRVLPNGCDIASYPKIPKIPGRVLYASSPDRGLHWLLQQWPKIKCRVPDANLRVFYNFDDWLKNVLPYEGPEFHSHLRECSYRAHYIREALERLRKLDVVHFKSVSRVRMAEEMASAKVLAYPCDTVTYTEGFSVTLMEACAAGAVPVTVRVDSLGSIYGDSLKTMVPSPVRDHLDIWTDYVVQSLNDEHEDVVDKARVLASKHDWSVLTDRLSSILEESVLRLRRAS